MTKPINHPTSLEETHATKIDRETLVNQIAEIMVKENKTALRAVCDLLQELRHDGIFYISGSSFVSGNANPLHYIVSRTIKPFYGENINLVMGSAYHKAQEFASKYFIEKGKYPRLGLQIRKGFEYINEKYDFLKPEDKEENSKNSVYKYLGLLLKTYLSEQAKNTPMIVEEFLKVEVPEDMVQNPRNALRILLTGASDIIYDVDGVMVMSDHKTSKKPISVAVEKSEALVNQESELKEIMAEIVKLEKSTNKLSATQQKLSDAEATLEENTRLLQIANEEGKATTALQKRVDKWSGEVIKQDELVRKIEEDVKLLLAKDAEKEELEELIEPLMEVWLEEKAEADLAKAREMHEQQLAFYAICYMVSNPDINISRIRLENMVKAKTPYLQVFEWDLDEYVMKKAEEQIKAFVQRIELYMDGVDPLVLFPLGYHTYIGMDTNEMLRDAEKVAKLLDV